MTSDGKSVKDLGSRTLSIEFLLLPCMLLWLLAHPYQGIYHDARVYALIAAHWLYPEELASDLFFQFGSQGSLSLFTPIYSLLVAMMGLDAASRFVVLTGAWLWVTTIYLGARCVLPRPITTFMILFGTVASLTYSPNDSVFQLNENFATARSWALPLSLLSIVALMYDKVGIAVVLSILSSMLHPLLGIWAIATVVGHVIGQRWLIALVVSSFLIVPLLGVGNFQLTGLKVMDGEWLRSVSSPDQDVIPAQLSIHYVACIGMLALGFRRGSQKMQALYCTVGILAFAGFVSSQLTRLWPVEIVVQSQAWRVFAIAIPIAGLALGDVFARTTVFGKERWYVGGAIAGVIYLLPAIAPFFAWGGVVATLPFITNRLSFQSFITKYFYAIRFFSFAIWILAFPAVLVDISASGERFVIPWWNGSSMIHGFLAGGGWLLPLILAVMWQNKWAGMGIVVLSTLTLPWVLGNWDRRPLVKASREACYLNVKDGVCDSPHFQGAIAKGQSIWWPDYELDVLLRFRRPSYYSPLQGVGRVFSQTKFFEWRRRQQLVQRFSSKPQLICGAGGPDWFVSQVPIGTNTLHGSQMLGTTRWYLYRCSPN